MVLLNLLRALSLSAFLAFCLMSAAPALAAIGQGGAQVAQPASAVIQAQAEEEEEEEDEDEGEDEDEE